MSKVLDLCCGIGGASDGYRRAGFEVTGVDKVWQRHYPYEQITSDVLDVLEDDSFVRSFDLIHASPPCQGYIDCPVGGPLYREWYERGGRNERLIEPIRERLIELGVDYVIENVDTAPLIKERCLLICGTWTRKDNEEYGVIRHRLFECSWDIVEEGSIFEMMGGRLCWCNKANGSSWPKVGEDGWVTVAGGTGDEYRNVGIEGSREEIDVLPAGFDRLRLGGSIVRDRDFDQRTASPQGDTSDTEGSSGVGRVAEKSERGGASGVASDRDEILRIRRRVGTGAYIARRALGMDRGTKEELNECIPPAYTEIIGESYLSWGR